VSGSLLIPQLPQATGMLFHRKDLFQPGVAFKEQIQGKHHSKTCKKQQHFQFNLVT